MSTVVFSNRFQPSIARLASRDRRAVDSAVMEFSRGSTAKGLRLHKLNCRESRFYSISANDALRIIVLIDGDTRIMMHADQHDAAYRWAASHEVREHDLSRVPQIIEFVEAIEERVRFVEREIELPALFERVSDDELVAIGLPSTHVGIIRRVRDEESLTELGDAIPEEAWEALIEIADGADVQQLIDERSTPKQSAPPEARSMAEAIATPEARRRFWVAESEEALKQALQLPWAAWRVFLHTSQARAVMSNHSGPARITGGAGTGKSVVLVHRAARLASKNTEARVLLSTFSKVLALQLSASFDELIGAESQTRSRVTVQHLHAHAFSTLKHAGERIKPATNATVRRKIDEAISATGFAARSAAFVRDEWHHVVDLWGVNSLASYLGVARKGRGKALSKAQRVALWPVFQHVKEALRGEGYSTWSELCERATTFALQDDQRQYDHVLLDEAQDFGPRDLAYAASLAKGKDNALFLGGDDGQRIYRNPFPLTAVGINVRGRSCRLRVNYRTSAEIHAFAATVLPEETTDDDVPASRQVVSLFGGAAPQVLECTSRSIEGERIVRWIEKRLSTGIAVEEIAVFARSIGRMSAVEQAIEHSLGLVCTRLAGRREGALVKDTLHGGKGMEFRAVIVVGAEEGTLPLAMALEGDPRDEAHELSLARERHLLYVGCTRARDFLLITHVGLRSRFFEAPEI